MAARRHVGAFDGVAGNRAAIRLFVELDGLLQRFGRVFPDAAAMLAVVRHLRQRVKAMPRAPRLVVRAVRLGGSPGDEAELTALRTGLSGLEPWSAIGSLAASAVVAADPGDLSPATAEPARVILFTASHRWFQKATAAGVEAYHIGLGTPPERRGLPFDEVPRILEEALRIPTARPMARSTRTGGLVAIRTAGPADARARALAALLEDPAADWLTIGSDLILYTEQPDLEDRLSEQPGVEHLSYAVHKDALVLEPIAAAAAEGILYQGQGVSLREAAGTADVEARAASPSGWAAMRRRTLREEDQLARSPSPAILSADRYLAERLRFAPMIADRLDGRIGSPGERLLAAVREVAGPAAAPDLLLSRQAPAAVIWSTPYGGANRDDLVAIVRDAAPPGEGEGQDALAGEAAAALALADSLSSAPSSPGVLHCLRLAPETSIDELLAASLQAEERNRLLAVVHLEGLSDAGSQPCVLQVTADPRLDRRFEQLRTVAGGVVWTSRAGDGVACAHIRATSDGDAPMEAVERLLALVASIVA